LLIFAFIAGWYFNETSDKAVQRVAEKEALENINEPINDNKNVIPENENGESEEHGENTIKDFLADADNAASSAKTDDSDIISAGKTATSAVSAREKVLLPNELKPLEAFVAAKNRPDHNKEVLSAELYSGISSYEKNIISENAALVAEADRNKSEWRMGVNLSPGYSSFTSKYSDSYASNMTQDANEGNANMSGGISVQYKTAKRWSVESGIYYAQNGQQTGSSPYLFAGNSREDFSSAPERLYFNTSVKMEKSHIAMNSTAGIIEIANLPAGAEIAANLESSGMYDNSLMTQGEFSQVFDLIEIPLYLRYLLIDSKLDVELMGGVNAGVVVGNNAFLDNQYGSQNIGKTRDISTMNVSGTVGLGFSYELGKQFSLAMEPRLNYYLNSLSKNPEVEFKPYRIGFFTGLYYSF
jgi:hypothetical protein